MKPTDYRVEVVSWERYGDEIREIRTRVFIEEQNVPVELEWDGLDETSAHFIVRSDGLVIATARLKTDGQIGRMAVLKTFRRSGAGSALLSAVLAHAWQQGFSECYLHAQVQVIGFYQKHGFTAMGAEFVDAGIPHRAMSIKCAK